MLRGKKILLGVTGSIAAYKAATLVRLLIKEGATVKVVMTPTATTFIPPLTLSTLSKNNVLSELSENETWANHVMLGRWADIFLVAPLSCNTLSKMANGLCDNLLLAVYLSATCQVVIAPAMDEDMWKHPATQSNIKKLEGYGNKLIPVENGELASGIFGEGRMAEPEHIVNWLNNFFLTRQQFEGKNILVTAGPTHEKIDPVRFIGNYSSGKMGIAIAEEFKNRGAKVTLILGPSSEAVNSQINLIRVTSAAEMLEAVDSAFSYSDISVMCAAVADFRLSHSSDQKIKKADASLNLSLEKTTDILKMMGAKKREGQLLVGFALETNNEEANAREKLFSKNADMIVLNSLNDAGAGFGTDTNKITIFDNTGKELQYEAKSKKEVAADILNTIIQFSNAKN